MFACLCYILFMLPSPLNVFFFSPLLNSYRRVKKFNNMHTPVCAKHTLCFDFFSMCSFFFFSYVLTNFFRLSSYRNFHIFDTGPQVRRDLLVIGNCCHTNLLSTHTPRMARLQKSIADYEQLGARRCHRASPLPVPHSHQKWTLGRRFHAAATPLSRSVPPAGSTRTCTPTRFHDLRKQHSHIPWSHGRHQNGRAMVRHIGQVASM